MDNFSPNSPNKFEDLQARAARLTQEQSVQQSPKGEEFKLTVPENLPTEKTVEVAEVEPGQKAKNWHGELDAEVRRKITLELLEMSAKEAGATEAVVATEKEKVVEQASKVESGSAALSELTDLDSNRLGERGSFTPENLPELVAEKPALETRAPEVPVTPIEETPVAEVAPEVIPSDPSLIIEKKAGDTPRGLVEQMLNNPKIGELFSEIADLNADDRQVLEILLANEVTQNGIKYGLPEKLDANQFAYAA